MQAIFKGSNAENLKVEVTLSLVELVQLNGVLKQAVTSKPLSRVQKTQAQRLIINLSHVVSNKHLTDVAV